MNRNITTSYKRLIREESKAEDQKLDIHQIIAWLEDDDMLSAKDLEKCRQYAQAGINRHKHPLKILSECVLADKSSLANSSHKKTSPNGWPRN